VLKRSIPSHPAVAQLTGRQAEVLALMMQGKSNKAIARQLGLSEPTIKHHVTAILKAFAVTSRTEAVIVATTTEKSRSDARQGLTSATPASVSVSEGQDSAARLPTGESRLSLPDKPSIVVLPFVNLSGDVDQEYFADGIVEDITIALGRFAWLFIISSNSAFAYKGRTIDVRQVGVDLGVRYVLTGSVRKDEQRLRISAQLCDAADGGQIWADRFEGGLDSVFRLQDEVTARVTAMIAPTLRLIEVGRAQRKPTDNLTAHDLFHRALPQIHNGFSGNKRALDLLYKAIDLDASYSAAYGLAAWCYRLQKVYGWIGARDPEIAEGARLARIAVSINPPDSEARWMAGHALAHLTGELEYGLALVEEALELNPNSAGAWWAGGMLQAFRGNDAAAMEYLARAHRLNPLDTQPHRHPSAMIYAHFMAGRYQQAGQTAAMALNRRPTSAPLLRMKIVTCGLLGQHDEAREWVQRLLQITPDATVSGLAAHWDSLLGHNPRALEAYLNGLRLAGVPEGEL
jgi:TolB-like protein/DNA-binding CsgD family transcriptional regulator/Flp pilus assembly protein TadD